MLDLAGGIVPVPTGVAVTKAVALQVYLLFQQQRLKHLSFKHVYLVLASFSLGYRVNSAQTAAVERLRRFFSSREGGARVGLAEDYKERIYKRSRDEMLKQLTVPEARRHLMQLYDRDPLNFSFAEVAGGGGGGDPGGSGTATTAPAPTPPALGPLDVRTRALATQLTLMAAGAHCDFAKGAQPYFWDRTAERWVQSTGPTAWSDRLGEIPLEVLRIIDGTVRQVKLPLIAPSPADTLRSPSVGARPAQAFSYDLSYDAADYAVHADHDEAVVGGRHLDGADEALRPPSCLRFGRSFLRCETRPRRRSC